MLSILVNLWFYWSPLPALGKGPGAVACGRCWGPSFSAPPPLNIPRAVCWVVSQLVQRQHEIPWNIVRQKAGKSWKSDEDTSNKHRTTAWWVKFPVVSDSLWPHELCSLWNSPGQNTGVGSLSLLQWIFPTQESNQGLLYCRQILYQLSYLGSPNSR